MRDATESLFDARHRHYVIRVCGTCAASLDWLPDDGEGMAPRAWCRGSDRHLVVDDKGASIQPVAIEVEAVAYA